MIKSKVNLLISSEQRATLILVQSVGYSVKMILFFLLARMIGNRKGLECAFSILVSVLVVYTILARKFQSRGSRGDKNRNIFN